MSEELKTKKRGRPVKAKKPNELVKHFRCKLTTTEIRKLERVAEELGQSPTVYVTRLIKSSLES